MTEESKEVQQEVQQEETKPKAKRTTKTKTVKQKPKAKKYAAKSRMWHPFQKVYITEQPIEVELDSWLESQIAVGLIKEV